MELGAKIKRLRLQCGLTQEELADRCELTKGYISQLENELTSPSIQTLLDVLSALGTTAAEFFSEDEEEQIVFTSDDFFEKDAEGHVITWLVPNSQRNEMEPILITREKSSVSSPRAAWCCTWARRNTRQRRATPSITKATKCIILKTARRKTPKSYGWHRRRPFKERICPTTSSKSET